MLFGTTIDLNSRVDKDIPRADTLQVNKLPYDVQEAIVAQAEYRNLKSISRVSRAYHGFVRARLFHTITFGTHESSYYLLKGISQVVRQELSQQQPPAIFSDVKYIRLTAPFHLDIWARCEVCDMGGGLGRIMDILAKFQPHSLRGFHYDIGSCLPNQLFLPPLSSHQDDPQGRHDSHLLKRQKNIESLSLITDAYCVPHGPYELWDRRTIALASFERLRRLSWRGLWRPNEVAAVREF